MGELEPRSGATSRRQENPSRFILSEAKVGAVKLGERERGGNRCYDDACTWGERSDGDGIRRLLKLSSSDCIWGIFAATNLLGT